MPSSAPLSSEQANARLQLLGSQLRARRKSLGVSAVVAAEAAGLSRVTLHRIEKGEPSVTMGAWCNVAAALGMRLQLEQDGTENGHATAQAGWWPVRIALADYPQLKALAWQVQGADHLTPVEAHGIYERQARHLDLGAMTPQEHGLWRALREAFGNEVADV